MHRVRLIPFLLKSPERGRRQGVVREANNCLSLSLPPGQHSSLALSLRENRAQGPLTCYDQFPILQ